MSEIKASNLEKIKRTNFKYIHSKLFDQSSTGTILVDEFIDTLLQFPDFKKEADSMIVLNEQLKSVLAKREVDNIQHYAYAQSLHLFIKDLECRLLQSENSEL